jgi:uncharacterized protein (TIGR03067 family)
MWRLLFALAALPPLAFAPAPFRRPARQTDDLKAIQGDWVRVTRNGKAEEPNDYPATIKGNLMRYPNQNYTYVLTLDQKASPRRIDLVSETDQKYAYRGIYRLEGDTLTISLRRNYDGGTNRATDFDLSQPDAWVGVYKRRR